MEGLGDPADIEINPWNILDAVPLALALVDDQGHVCYVNAAWQRLTTLEEACSLECTLGHSFFAHHPGSGTLGSAGRTQLLAGLSAILNKQCEHFECEYEWSAGSMVRTAEVTILPYAQADRLGALVQVDRVRRAACSDALPLGERELLNALMESMPEQIYFKDRQGRFVRINAVQARVLGLNSPDEAYGKTDFDFYLPEICQGAREDEQRIIATGEPLIDKTEAQTLAGRDGTDQETNVAWFSTTKAPLKDQNGTVIGIVGITRNITTRKMAEEAVRQRAAQEQIIDSQARVLEELSTPLIPLTNDVLLMPLIGTVDSVRAQQVVETLLKGIEVHRARVAILDITGVPIVDTQVGNVLIQAAYASRMLGARVILTGIRPEIAQTLVGLGIELKGIETRGSLQRGIASVLQ